MNKQQVNWASQHDWFVKTVRCQVAEQYEFVIGVEVREVLLKIEEGEYQEEILNFTDFKELREWAGY